MTTQELRNKAADYIEAHGWCQGTSEDFETGAVCMFGALWNVAAAAGLWRLLADTQSQITNQLGKPIGPWNDAPERTKDEVIAKLRGEAVNS